MSIIRIIAVRQANFGDMPWDFAVLAYWAAVEINLAVICPCLTTLKPLVDRFFPRLLGSTAPTHPELGENIANGGGQGPMRPHVMSTIGDTERGCSQLDDVSTHSTGVCLPLDAHDLADQSDKSPKVTTPPEAHT